MLAFNTLPVSWDESAQQPCSVSITQPSASKALTQRNLSNASLDTAPQNSDQPPGTHEANMNPPSTTGDVKRPILDESGHHLADVLKALKEYCT
jgi:hypothetical protein